MPISYDGALNPLSYVINGSECTLTWTQGRRLASISGEEGTDYTYTYNDEGIRTGKTVNGVEHIYHLSGTQILSEEWTENGVQHLIVYSYDASGYPISMTYRKSADAAATAEVYFLATNLQGDVTYIYDIDGNRVVTYNYDAWGNILSITGTKATTIGRYNPFRYRSYYYDNETGFYYLNSRYYDPSSGRFLDADVYIDGNGDIIGFNLFAYCGNNPVMGYDPSGRGKFIDAIKTFVARIDRWLGEQFKPLYDYMDYLGDLIAKVPETAWNSLEYEVGLGFGWGSSYEVDGFGVEAHYVEDDFYIKKQAGSDVFIGRREEFLIDVSGCLCSFATGTAKYYDFDGNLLYSQDYYPGFDFSVSTGVSRYALLGFTFSFGFNIEYFVDTLFGYKVLGLD